MLKPFSKNISKEYRALAKIHHNSEFNKKIENLLYENGLFYGNSTNFKIANYFSQPSFFGQEISMYFQNIISDVNNLILETYSILNKHPTYFKYLGFSKNSLDFQINSVNPTHLLRVDGGILKHNKKLIFMELNSNNPGGLYNCDGIEKILLECDPVLKELEKKYKITNYNRFDLFTETIVGAYDKFKLKNNKDLGDLLIILGVGTEQDISYIQIKKGLTKRGIESEIVMSDNPNLKLIYENGKVMYNGRQVAIINRRIESKKSLAPVSFLKKASKNQDVCVINPFSSGVFGMKKLFILFHHPLFQNHLSNFSKNFINRYIPKTYDFKMFIDGPGFEDFLDQKDLFVLKMNDSDKGNGVFIGRDYSKKEWEKKLLILKSEQKKLMTSSIIVQEFMDFTKIGGRHYDYNLLSLNGKFVPFVRVAKNGDFKTNIAQGGSYVPCFYYEKNN